MASPKVDFLDNGCLHLDKPFITWNKRFTHATFHVDREELKSAYVPEFQAIGYYRPFFDYEGIHWGAHGRRPAKWSRGSRCSLARDIRRALTLWPPTLDSHLMILTVDTTFTKENMEHKVPMGIHANLFQLVESMERLERLTLAEKGKRYVSHDMEEFNTYKKAPGYCE
jgi:hypothetical protein